MSSVYKSTEQVHVTKALLGLHNTPTPSQVMTFGSLPVPPALLTEPISCIDHSDREPGAVLGWATVKRPLPPHCPHTGHQPCVGPGQCPLVPCPLLQTPVPLLLPCTPSGLQTSVPLLLPSSSSLCTPPPPLLPLYPLPSPPPPPRPAGFAEAIGLIYRVVSGVRGEAAPVTAQFNWLTCPPTAEEEGEGGRGGGCG